MTKKQNAEPEVLGEAMTSTELFLEKNGRKFSYIFVALLLIAGIIYGYRAMIVMPRHDRAAEMIAGAQHRFEAQTPDYELALNGDAEAAGFLEVVEEYGSTPSGNLAKHYAGVCYLHMGDLDNAAKYLAQYDAVDGLPGAVINAQNLGLQGDVAVEKGDYKAAVKFFEEAAQAADNNLTTPRYLYKGGLAAKAQGDLKVAEELFQKILYSYPASVEARDAEKMLGTLK